MEDCRYSGGSESVKERIVETHDMLGDKHLMCHVFFCSFIIKQNVMHILYCVRSVANLQMKRLNEAHFNYKKRKLFKIHKKE